MIESSYPAAVEAAGTPLASGAEGGPEDARTASTRAESPASKGAPSTRGAKGMRVRPEHDDFRDVPLRPNPDLTPMRTSRAMTIKDQPCSSVASA